MVALLRLRHGSVLGLNSHLTCHENRTRVFATDSGVAVAGHVVDARLQQHRVEVIRCFSGQQERRWLACRRG